MGSVLLCGNFPRPASNSFRQTLRLAIVRQLYGKSFRQAVLKIDPLNAALLQQSATRSALRRTGDLATIDNHVGAHGVRKAIVAASAEGDPYGIRSAAGVTAPGYNRTFPVAAHGITQDARFLIELRSYFPSFSV